MDPTWIDINHSPLSLRNANLQTPFYPKRLSSGLGGWVPLESIQPHTFPPKNITFLNLIPQVTSPSPSHRQADPDQAGTTGSDYASGSPETGFRNAIPHNHHLNCIHETKTMWPAPVGSGQSDLWVRRFSPLNLAYWPFLLLFWALRISQSGSKVYLPSSLLNRQTDFRLRTLPPPLSSLSQILCLCSSIPPPPSPDRSDRNSRTS